MKKILLAGIISSTLSVVAIAEDNSDPQKYFGVGLGFYTYDEIGFGEADLTSSVFRAGAKFNEYIAAEGRLGFGITGDSVLYLGQEVDVDLNYLFGAYLRAGIPASDKVFPYIVAGFTRGEVAASALGVSVEVAESDMSYGFGIDIDASDKVTLNAEYINLLDKNEAEVGGVSLGVAVNF